MVQVQERRKLIFSFQVLHHLNAATRLVSKSVKDAIAVFRRQFVQPFSEVFAAVLREEWVEIQQTCFYLKSTLYSKSVFILFAIICFIPKGTLGLLRAFWWKFIRYR
jgi:hypothetical protein